MFTASTASAENRIKIAEAIWLAFCVTVIVQLIHVLLLHSTHVAQLVAIHFKFACSAIGLTWALLFLLAVAFRKVTTPGAWYVFGVFIGVTWLANLSSHVALNFILVGTILVAYFILEGCELAVTVLLDKDDEQLSDKILAAILEEIKGHTDTFYDAREWFIVLLAVTMTVSSDFRNFRVPLFPECQAYPSAHWMFSILFTTFIIVWVSQIPPKRLATASPEGFLRFVHFSTLWPLIRLLSRSMELVQLHAPSGPIVNMMRRSPLLSSQRNLRPSDPAYFMYGLQIYTFGYFSVRDEVTIQAGGKGRLVERALLYFIGRPPRDLEKKFHFDAAATPVRQDCWAYSVPMVGESFNDELEKGLQSIFDKNFEGLGEQFKAIDEATIFMTQKEPANEGKDFLYTLNAAINDDDIGRTESGVRRALAIGFEMEFEIAEGCFKVPSNGSFANKVFDKWSIRFDFPRRFHALKVSVDPELKMRLVRLMRPDTASIAGLESEAEAKKIFEDHFDYQTMTKSVRYPSNGAIFNLFWEIWPTTLTPE